MLEVYGQHLSAYDSCCLMLQVAGFGIGTQQQGAWYFAYGANMCTGKLTGSRGITPLESVPGFLQGWRLSFNHRCSCKHHCSVSLSLEA